MYVCVCVSAYECVCVRVCDEDEIAICQRQACVNPK